MRASPADGMNLDAVQECLVHKISELRLSQVPQGFTYAQVGWPSRNVVANVTFSCTGSAFVHPGVDVMTASSPAPWPDQSKQHAQPRPLNRCTSAKDSKFRTFQACTILTEIIGF